MPAVEYLQNIVFWPSQAAGDGAPWEYKDWTNPGYRKIYGWRIFAGGEDQHVGDVLTYVQRGVQGPIVADFNFHNGPRYASQEVSFPFDYGAGNYLATKPGDRFIFTASVNTGGLFSIGWSVIVGK